MINNEQNSETFTGNTGKSGKFPLDTKIATIFVLAFVTAILVGVLIADKISDNRYERERETYQALIYDLTESLELKNQAIGNMYEEYSKEIDSLKKNFSTLNDTSLNITDDTSFDELIYIADRLMIRHNNEYLSWLNDTEILLDNARREWDRRHKSTRIIYVNTGGVS